MWGRLVVEYMEDQLEGEAGLEGAGVEERHQLAVQRGQVGGGQGGLARPSLVLGLQQLTRVMPEIEGLFFLHCRAKWRLGPREVRAVPVSAWASWAAGLHTPPSPRPQPPGRGPAGRLRR